MVTSFGKAVRKYRIDKGVILKEMADGVDVSIAYLSAVETGKKKAPRPLIEKIALYFDLDAGQKRTLIRLAEESQNEYKISVQGADTETRRLVASFARKFSTLTEEERKKMMKLMNTGDEGD